MRSLRAILAIACAGLATAPAAAGAEGLRAGAARGDITPRVGTPMFAYTARSAIAGGHVDRPMQIVADPDHHLYAKSFVPSTGIHTRVQARAIVLERDGEKFALVQADLGGVPYALTQEVARRIAATGITADRLLLSATHTHSSTGPIWPSDSFGYQALGGDFFDPRAFEATAAGIAEAIVRADDALAPARLGVGTTELTNASRNRNIDPFRLNADVPEDDAAALAASIDRVVTVVRVDDERGRPVAVWSNFAIHPTSFGDENLLFSGDNAAFTERIVESELARSAKGRDVVNVWTNSNEGDISPNGGPDTIAGEAVQHVTSPFASAHLAGERVAAGILRAWSDAGERMTAEPAIGARRSFLAFDGTSAGGEPVGPIAVLGQGGITADDGTCAPVDGFAGPGQGMKMPALMGAGLVPSVVPVSMWRIAGLGVAAFPSEITKQMGERIRTALAEESAGGYERVALAGLTNAYVSYTATPEEYDACHYEGSFTLFGRHQGARYLGVAQQLSGALLGDAGTPAGAPEPPPLGLGSEADAPPRETPGAGTVVEQPAERVTRTARAAFRWKGGDPSVDAPRGETFVTVERRTGKAWTPAFTDDGFRDTTERTPGDVWTETVQFTECDPEGTYRVVVRGVADRGDGAQPYEVTSRAFRLDPVALAPETPTVEGTTARVRATYPSPGEGALLALPRLVRTGEAELRVTPPDGDARTVVARPDAATGTFAATVPAGSAVTLLSLRDGCGNTA